MTVRKQKTTLGGGGGFYLGLTALTLAASLNTSDTAHAEKPTLPEVIVVGEEHRNPAYQGIIINSLPSLLQAGYSTFAAEKPLDLQHDIDDYIASAVNLDEARENKALWNILLSSYGQKPSKAGGGSHSAPNAGVWRQSLLPLVHARVVGMDVQLVDFDIAKMSGYLAYGKAGDGQKTLKEAAILRTLEARNLHMADLIRPHTVLVVGRAHTGSNPRSVEHFLRQRGIRALSIDLIGNDQHEHPKHSEEADLQATPEQIKKEGGLLPYIKNRLPSPAPREQPNES